MMEVYGYAMTEAAELVASEMMSAYFAAMFAFSWRRGIHGRGCGHRHAHPDADEL